MEKIKEYFFNFVEKIINASNYHKKLNKFIIDCEIIQPFLLNYIHQIKFFIDNKV